MSERTPYERVRLAEEALGTLDVAVTHIDLVNLIRDVLSDRDIEDEDVIARAYNTLVAIDGGVTYDAEVGKFYYDTVRDRVQAELEARNLIPAKPAFWIVLQRENLAGLALHDFHIGPFPSLEASTYALDNSALIESIATDTKRDWTLLDVRAPEEPYVPEGYDDNITIIDPDDPDHDPYTNA